MSTDLMAPVLRLHASAKELADFIKLVERLEAVRRAAKSATSSDDVAAATIQDLAPVLASAAWKRQYYSFVIVQLYGMHERFIRDLVESFARFLGQVFSSYDDLPDRIRRQHLLLTLQHLQELGQNPADDLADLQNDLRRLGNCLDGIIQLNERAMSRHTANFRHEVIKSVLLRLDFELVDAMVDDCFATFPYGSLNGLYATPESVIDDLANRRNEVAHGSDFDLLDLETLKDISDTVYNFDVWLLRSLAYHQLSSLVDRHGIEIGEVRHVYTDKETERRTVGSFEDVGSEVRTGSSGYLVGSSAMPCLVKEIQIRNAKVVSALPGNGPAGINFNVEVKVKQRFKILDHKWSEVEPILRKVIQEAVYVSFSDHLTE